MKKHMVFWLLNDQLTKSGIRNQLKSMADSKIGGVFFHAMPSEFSSLYPEGLPGYLSKQWFEMIRYAILTAAEFGIESWLYDEGGWPSGRANGIILKEHPEWALTVLRRNADKTGIDRIVFSERPDLRRKEVVRRFIELTHEQYFKRLGDDVWKHVRGIFTDEPFFGNFQIIKTDWDNFGMPWTPDFPAAFKKQFHYSAMEAVQKIFYGTAEESAQTIREARDVLSKLAFRNYFGAIKSWCHKHNILAVGHTGGEHMPTKMAQLYGDGFEMYREFDIPGLDTIIDQIFPADHETDFPKYITSSARHSGRRRVFSESYAVYGYDCTYEQMRQVADAQYVFGVTDIIPMALYYSTRGARQFEHCCNLFKPDPRWDFYADFASYNLRMATLLSAGTETAEVAVLLPFSAYLPPEQIYHYPSGLKPLLEGHFGYDYVGEHELLRATLIDNMLKVGKVFYKVLVVPPEKQLTEPLKQQIADLKNAGLAVVSDSNSDMVKEFVNPDLPIGKGGENVRVLRLKRRNEIFYFMFNAGKETVTTLCRPDSRKTWEWYDAVSDTSSAADFDADGNMLLKIAGLTSIILRKRTENCISQCHNGQKVPLCGTWEKTMRKYFVFSDDGFKTKKYCPGAKDITEDCGVFDFTNTFKCVQVPKKCMLNLDRKLNGMWEIFVNGKLAGKTAWTPYCVDIADFLKRGKNRLVCRLTTPAGRVYRSPKVCEYIKSRGWFNSCVENMLKFQPAPLPSVEDLPNMLEIFTKKK